MRSLGAQALAAALAAGLVGLGVVMVTSRDDGTGQPTDAERGFAAARVACAILADDLPEVTFGEFGGLTQRSALDLATWSEDLADAAARAAALDGRWLTLSKQTSRLAGLISPSDRTPDTERMVDLVVEVEAECRIVWAEEAVPAS